MRSWIALALLGLVIGGAPRTALGAPAVRSASAPNFTLTDQYGHAFTLSKQRGLPVVLFFGYTHCPDVCPTILANLKAARNAIGLKSNQLVVALITVDPGRDTPHELGAFVSVFDPAFLGLTGSSGQLSPIYRAYHVRSAKGQGNSSGYLVSHTAFVYYIGRNGRLRGFGTWNDPEPTLEANLREIR